MKITIPSPCSENWATMTTTEQGRFCASCQKCVVDFTAMTDAEIVRYFNRDEEKTCGRFTKEQLNRPLTVPNRLTIPFAKWVLASMVSLSFLSPKEGFAAVLMVQTERSLVFLGKDNKVESVENEILTDSVVIKGTVVDSVDKMGLFGCSIVIKGSTTGAVADSAGHFILNIPIEYQQKTFTLVFLFVGYETQEIVVKPTSIQARYDIKMSMSTMVLGGPWYTPKPTLWQRIKRVFRKRNH
jgi:hypothetical protein